MTPEEEPAPAGVVVAGDASSAGGSGGSMRHLLLAVTFLTGIPLPVRGEVTAAQLRRSMGWYPLVGFCLGAVAWGLFGVLLLAVPGLVAAVLVVIALEVLTRGLHMDGLMDTADGLLSGASRERALEIMKDSRVGAMGVTAAILIVLLKVVALGALTRADAAAPLLAGWAAARTLPALSVYAWPYARREGTGAAFTQERTRGPAALAVGLLLAALLVAVVVGQVVGAAVPWWATLLIVVAAAGVALAVQAVVAKRLGGLTGDVYGMGIQVAEAVALVVGCAFVG